MDLGLRDKVALITGGSRGIGRATALELAAEGCRVAIAARGPEALAETAEAIQRAGGACHPIAADLAEPAAVGRVVDEAAAHWGRLDILVNNVGGSHGPPSFMKADDAAWQEVFDFNLWAAVRATRAAVPHLRQQGGGRVIIVSSVYGREAGGPVTYNVAKAAEISLGKALSRELARDNILVNTVAPGSVLFPGGSWDKRQQENPEMIAAFVKAEMPLGRFGRAEEVAAVIAFLCSERASLVTGASIPVDGSQGRSNL